VHVAVDEVVDHLNVIANIELAQGALPQVLRDGGDSIALLDGETGNGKVGAVEAHQRDVGAVQGGHEGQLAPARLGGHHLARQQRAYRMRNRIVHVQQIKV